MKLAIACVVHVFVLYLYLRVVLLLCFGRETDSFLIHKHKWQTITYALQHTHCWLPPKLMYSANSAKRLSCLTRSTPIFYVEECAHILRQMYAFYEFENCPHGYVSLPNISFSLIFFPLFLPHLFLKLYQTDTAVLNPVISTKLRVARFTSSL